VRRAKVGKGIADKLFKVWLHDGGDYWLLIHIEVQGAYDPGFAERMFRYNVAAYALYDREVVSLAVLGDDNPAWRPSAFGYGRWGCRTGIDFLPVKLLDHAGALERLEGSANPLAAVVLAHLQAQATRGDPLSRRQWKLRIVKGLYERGWTADDIRELFRLIDWILDLPEDLQEAFRSEVHEYEEDKGMPYVTSIERLARKEGRQEGREEGREEGRKEGLREGLLEGITLDLEAKFGPRGSKLLPRIQAIQELAELRELTRAIKAANKLEEIRKRLR
jgi:hypothetical protein